MAKYIIDIDALGNMKNDNVLDGKLPISEVFVGKIECRAVTNADKIRNMSDKELAELLIKTDALEEVLYYAPDGDRFDCYESCIEHTLKWLNS